MHNTYTTHDKQHNTLDRQHPESFQSQACTASDRDSTPVHGHSYLLITAPYPSYRHITTIITTPDCALAVCDLL